MQWIKKVAPDFLFGITITLITCVSAYLILLLAILFDFIYLDIQIDKKGGLSSMIGIIFATKAYLFLTLVYFLKMLNAIKKGVPFRSDTIKRFYILGFLVLIFPFINFSANILFIVFEVNVTSNIDLFVYDSWINRISAFAITGIMIVAFAHVLNTGLSIYEEQKLTV